MIRLTRINHVPLVLNADLIEHIEITPDTVIAMTSGQKFMVLESADEVIERVIEFRRLIMNRNQPAVVRTAELSTSDQLSIEDEVA
jgi:flagellar protein FlbD